MSRTIYPINRNWLYGGRFVKGSMAPDFDDAAFERVTIPHTNVRLPWHSFDDKLFQFVSVYRRHLTLPKRHRGQRIFVDFDGVMTAAALYINGTRLGEHTGGYTPFSEELTDHIDWDGDNVLAVKVDSRERPDIPPFGGNIDYLTFGGIYRDVRVRVVPDAFISNVFAKPVYPRRRTRRVDVKCTLDLGGTNASTLSLAAELRDGDKVLAAVHGPVTGADTMVVLRNLPDVELWDIDHPRLYTVAVRLLDGGKPVDQYAVRIGFREATFTPRGFMLNGRHVKLRGLNRHQTFPYVGQAMPARVQRRDALILKHDLKCNVVRTSHYPQSPHFLDACDEIGLLVFEEIPGWQHIGDAAWKDVACRNVVDMIRRDWNHPAIILWGVRINESRDDHDFYTRTNAIAHALDDSRQTGGVRCFYESERLEDVYTMNDFNPFELKPPNHPLYLNTEFCGHMFPTKHIDNVERVTEHVLRHARVHNMLGADRRYAGGIGWCAFDYNTHHNFGAGDGICYHGVADIFRIPKPAAGLYKSQCDPADEVVLEPAFHWAIGDRSGGGAGVAWVCSNCGVLEFYRGGKLVATVKPDRETFPNLPHPPFKCTDLGGVWGLGWVDLRIDGYIKRKKVISRTLSARGVDAQFHADPDDAELLGDGIDATRLVLRVTDEFGNPRPFATGAIQLDLDGPGEIIGENPFALTGGCGAVWIRTTESPGTIRLTATHPVLGAATKTIKVRKAPPERC